MDLEVLKLRCWAEKQIQLVDFIFKFANNHIIGRPSPKNVYTSSSKRSSNGGSNNLFGADSALNGSKGPSSGAGIFYKSKFYRHNSN